MAAAVSFPNQERATDIPYSTLLYSTPLHSPAKSSLASIIHHQVPNARFIYPPLQTCRTVPPPPDSLLLGVGKVGKVGDAVRKAPRGALSCYASYVGGIIVHPWIKHIICGLHGLFMDNTGIHGSFNHQQ